MELSSGGATRLSQEPGPPLPQGTAGPRHRDGGSIHPHGTGRRQCPMKFKEIQF